MTESESEKDMIDLKFPVSSGITYAGYSRRNGEATPNLDAKVAEEIRKHIDNLAGDSVIVNIPMRRHLTSRLIEFGMPGKLADLIVDALPEKSTAYIFSFFTNGTSLSGVACKENNCFNIFLGESTP